MKRKMDKTILIEKDKLHLVTLKDWQEMRKNDTMWFEGERMQLEDMLIEVSQDQKHKRPMFSPTCGR
jgi:hypothetical protein